jgi:hypothetical protein
MPSLTTETMRKLTIKQKKMLDYAIEMNGGIERVYSSEDLTGLTTIDALNPCEIFCQNVDRYIADKKFSR